MSLGIYTPGPDEAPVVAAVLGLGAIPVSKEFATDRFQVKFSCPCEQHGKGNGDANQSAHLTGRSDGKCVVFCHAGCEHVDILRALGLAEKDLYPPSTRRLVGSGRRSRKPAFEKSVEVQREWTGDLLDDDDTMEELWSFGVDDATVKKWGAFRFEITPKFSLHDYLGDHQKIRVGFPAYLPQAVEAHAATLWQPRYLRQSGDDKKKIWWGKQGLLTPLGGAPDASGLLLVVEGGFTALVAAGMGFDVIGFPSVSWRILPDLKNLFREKYIDTEIVVIPDCGEAAWRAGLAWGHELVKLDGIEDVRVLRLPGPHGDDLADLRASHGPEGTRTLLRDLWAASKPVVKPKRGRPSVVDAVAEMLRDELSGNSPQPEKSIRARALKLASVRTYWKARDIAGVVAIEPSRGFLKTGSHREIFLTIQEEAS